MNNLKPILLQDNVTIPVMILQVNNILVDLFIPKENVAEN